MTRVSLTLLSLVLIALSTFARAENDAPPAEVQLSEAQYLVITYPLLEKQLLLERAQHEMQQRDDAAAAAVAKIARGAGGGDAIYSLDLANRKLVLVTTTTTTPSSSTTSTTAPPS